MMELNPSLEPNEIAVDSDLIKSDGNDEWKQRRAVPLTEQTPIILRDSNFTKINQDDILREEEHTRIFASLVPDEVINNIDDYTRRNFDACLLFGDVSGFTDLCEKYNKTGKGGPSKLTQVLNSYIGAMVQEILSHGGDVFKFSGDAFIAIWKVSDNLSMKDAVHETLDCSLVIQKTYGKYQADQGVVIRVKLSISAGPLTFSLLGDKQCSYYFIFGPPILDLKGAEVHSFAGDIIITKKAWQHVSPNEYLAEELKDGLHIKIFGVGPNWRSIQRATQFQEDKVIIDSVDDDTGATGNLSDTSESSEEGSLLSGRKYNDETNNTGASISSPVYNNSDKYALRPSVNLSIRTHLLPQLKKFIITPVERGVTADEPIEYLTEIRQVTVVFINGIVDIKTETSSLGVIDIADAAFKAVSSIVGKNYGCLNKLNMFDKDLLMLVIFGLRGLKHEMECQTALKCAKECANQLKAIPHMIGVGIGVTTGKTYCGAFGHALRREYTVISLIVNKAARLMTAYSDKVTCDRETFLHSKLEARNFVLQPFKYLKGIVTPGPIYEFVEMESSRNVALAVSSRPLLGRHQEMLTYQHLFKLARTNPVTEIDVNGKHGMLMIQGESRQGKTRLLEELIYSSDADVPICRFTLTKTDQYNKFTTIRLLFNGALGLEEKSSMSTREAKIFRRLHKSGMDNQAHVLNDVFNVNFREPQEYQFKEAKEKYLELKEIFANFCCVVFSTFWLIAIDDSEFVDDESWVLIRSLMKLNRTFIICTIGLRSMITNVAMEVLRSPFVKVIKIKPIDKWFHVGLACQMLNVDGVPAELEKVIQSRSNGNPGWVESFLITLLQSGGLFIKQTTRKMAYETGLVLAPLYMMERLSDEEQSRWIEIMEEGQGPAYLRWRMYVDSCRESFPDLSKFEGFSQKLNLNELINVCILNTSFNIDEVDPELSMDVIILKTFDSLTSYEQLLVKCSSVLGDIFPRDMLMYIMNSSAIRLTSLAVKKLFEIRVLGCSKGNFIEGGLIFEERLKNPNQDTRIICECKGLIIPETCADLPKYASCGYIRFISTTFRETTYNLLTDNQKKEFHARAIRYLEKETKKCRSCGNGYFTKYMGNKLDYDLRSARGKKKKRTSHIPEISSQTGSLVSALPAETDTFRFSVYSSGSTNETTRNAKDSTQMSYSSSSYHTSDLISPPSKPDLIIDIDGEVMVESRMGLNTIERYKNDYNITKTFSEADFSQCTCLLILTTMYTQMIDHCNGAGLAEKTMSAMIDFCYVCIVSQNVPLALKTLEEAFELLDGPLKQTLSLDWMVKLKRGKLLALLGYGRLKLGQYEEGYQHLLKALDCYGVKFPSNALGIQIEKAYLSFKRDFSLYFFPRFFSTRTTDEDKFNYYNDIAECMTFMFRYFIRKKLYQEAKLAALWALDHAKWSETDFSLVAISYANMIQICTYFGEQYENIALEVFAFEFCQRKKDTVERDELRAIAKMYHTIFYARVTRSEFEKSIHIGYLLWRIGSSTHLIHLQLKLLPLLASLIILKKHITESASIINEVLNLSVEDVDISGKIWYYAMTVCFQLETGLIVIPHQKCKIFAEGEGKEPALRDPDAKIRLIVVIWLWNVRAENYEVACIWEEEVMKFIIKTEGESIPNLISGLYLLEGVLVLLVRKMDKKSIRTVEYLQRKADKLFKILFKAGQLTKIIMPRLYHLKAYYCICMTNKYSVAVKILNKAIAIARKHGNDMELAWISYNDLAWCNKLSRAERNQWRQHIEENAVEYNYGEEYFEKSLHFALPIPLYL